MPTQKKTSSLPDNRNRSKTRPVIYLALTLAVLLFAVIFPPVGNSPSMKVVITEDGSVGRYISEDESTYTFSGQDVITVDKANAKIKTYYAAKGKGVVYMVDYGTLDVKARPSAGSKTVSKLVYERGYVPETYQCVGYTNKGWFKIKTQEGTGYVYKDKVLWDVIDSF